MSSAVRIAHVSLTARNAERLAMFYRAVFGFEDRRPPSRLTGKAVSRGNGLPDIGVQSFWLHLPQAPQCFLEILQYDVTQERPVPAVNATGLGHIALVVADIRRTCAAILRYGGTKQGEIADLGSPDQPIRVVYIVRRQGFWDSWRCELREGLAHLVHVITRRICGEASVAFRWSFV